MTEETELGRRVVVVSPHLDDAVLSLGATIARAGRTGSAVSVVTVFAGDPSSTAPADEWARRCGFTTAGEGYRARREEDRHALGLLRARPVWLPFDGDAPDEAVLDRLRSELRHADDVLVPGSPCSQSEHARVASLVVSNPPAGRLGLYVDQPYAMWRLLSRRPRLGTRRSVNLMRLLVRSRSVRHLQQPQIPAELLPLLGRVRWHVVSRSLPEWQKKLRAVYRYRSQVRGFGPITVPGIAIYEASVGGEMIGRVER